MTTHAPPTTLAAFLLARAAEDEAVALAALTVGDPWTATSDDDGGTVLARRGDHAWSIADCDYAPQAAHIARHDPARVLAEVAALRAVVELHQTVPIWPDGTGGAKYYTGSVMVCASCERGVDLPCPTLRALAQPYADHPEFDPGWRA